MAKKKVNAKAVLALKQWRDSLPRDKNGKIIYPKRKSADEVLAEKKLKLAKLQKEVDELKAEIAKLDARVNNKKIKELIGQFTLEELMEKLGN